MSFPQVIVEVGFGDTPVTPYFRFDEGRFDYDLLGPDFVGTDISGDVRAITITRGRQRLLEACGAGTCDIVLDNRSGDYDPNNNSGTYVSAGVSLVRPMVRVRVRAQYDGVWYTKFTGFADAWDQTYPGFGKDAVCVLRCSDAFKLLARHEPGEASSEAGSGESTGTRIGRLLDSASWPTQDRDLDTGNFSVQATTLADNTLSEMQSVTLTEGGNLYVSTDGLVTFKGRHARYEDERSNTIQATFDDSGGASVVAGTETNFYRTNSTTTMGSTDGGGSLIWVPQSGTWGISGNQAYLVTATSQATTVVDTGLADGAVEVTVAVVGDGGPCFRATDDNNNFVVSASSAGVSQVYKRVAGAFTAVGASSAACANGDVLRIEMSGSNITFKVNGSTRATFSDSHNQTATKHGLRCHTATSMRFDGFSAPMTESSPTDGLPYADIRTADDDDLIKNSVAGTAIDGITQTWASSQSIGDFGIRSYNVTNLWHSDDSDVADWSYIGALFGDYSSRIDSILVKPQRSDALWPVVLSTELGDLMLVRRHPLHGDTISKYVFVEGTRHSITAARTWETELRFSSADDIYVPGAVWFEFDDATTGKLDTGQLAPF